MYRQAGQSPPFAARGGERVTQHPDDQHEARDLGSEQDLDVLLRQADPLAVDHGRRRASRLSVDDIREGIVGGSAERDDDVRGARRTLRRAGGPRPRLLQAVAVAAGVVAVATATTVALEQSGPDGSAVVVGAEPSTSSPVAPPTSGPTSPSTLAPPAGPPSTTVVPTSAPTAPSPSDGVGERYLMGPDWVIVRVEDTSGTDGPSGEMELLRADGAAVQLTWRPASLHETFLEDRRDAAAEEQPLEIDGATADLIRYDTPADVPQDFTAMWLLGDRSYELRGTAADLDDFAATAGTLSRVSEEEWAAAVPDQLDAAQQGSSGPPDAEALQSDGAYLDCMLSLGYALLYAEGEIQVYRGDGAVPETPEQDQRALEVAEAEAGASERCSAP